MMAQQIKIKPLSSPADDPDEARLVSLKTICQRSILGDRAFFPQGEFHGQTVFFCTEACQQVFLSDPERFITAHSKRRA
jgi:YHS domain-containing protein